ncbi:RsmB/NOP family class I SAM-dependent RNA methyltransferase [Roseobacter sp.]|uniref:RsmB/NOP family class I SAM-dependent RNA methyltransferase n=1 Tax=Roseobacter sp. TaxID=1907202 RepID=UPI0038589E09
MGEIVDRVLADWGRRNRYAGSKDRAAIADLVFDVLRRRRSLASLGGGDGGRALFLGYLRDNRIDPDTVFGAGKYAPAPITDAERSMGRVPFPNSSESADFPEWLWSDLKRALGDKTQETAEIMRHRAPVYIRVNLSRLDRDSALSELRLEGIVGHPHPLSPSAVEVVEGARKIRQTRAYLEGKIELQDASSQAVADMVPLFSGEEMLDFCAGGGGKTLAVAGRVNGVFSAYDAKPDRMKDLPARAARANINVDILSMKGVRKRSPFDVVLIDAPCSGSGSWRRDPQGKWVLTPEKLKSTLDVQKDILNQCVPFVRPKGHLVYSTCSLLDRENGRQVMEFLSHNEGFSCVADRTFTPLEGGDGFYCAVLRSV